MRYPLITPLASRDGTVDKDEHLVNCFGEQDDETKETRVIKRAGIDEGDAVISGNDIYGQGLFNYDGYLFSVIDDVLGYWVYVSGGIMYGGGGGTYFSFDTAEWAVGNTYSIGDKVFYEGAKYYSYSDSNTGNAPSSNPILWGTTSPPATVYYAAGFSTTGPDAATISAAAEALWVIAPVLKSCPGDYISDVWYEGYYLSSNLIYGNTYGTAGTRTCDNPANGPYPVHAGTVYGPV